MESFLDIFYLRGKVSPNVFLWFLIVLFIAEILFHLFMKIINSVGWDGSIGIVIFSCGLIGYELSGKTLPFGIGIAFTAIVFFGFGYVINKINFRKWKTLYLWLICLLLFALTFVFGMICNNIVIDMASARYGKYPLFLIAGGAGSLAILLFSVILERFANKHLSILKFWGKNSIVILVTQYFFFLILIAVDHLILKIGTGYVSNIRAVIDTIIIMAGETLIIFIINHYFPFVVGRKYENHRDN